MHGTKNIGRIFLIAAFIGVMCLLASPVIAASPRGDAGMQELPGGERGGNISGLLDHLEGLGFDLSTVREALTHGNWETARTLLDQFMQEHRDALPAPPAREISGETSVVLDTLEDAPPAPSGERGARMLGLLEQFEDLGYDMSAIRAAIAAGDTDNAQSLMRQFLEEHRDELPKPPAGDRGNRMPGLLDHLEEQGYDVTAIRAAVESGDKETARTLLDQFMQEHPDALPVPADSPPRGHMTSLLDRLEEQGYDVTAIRAAVESGDKETARTLLDQFMQEHPEEMPGPIATPGTSAAMTMGLDSSS
jgi:DNA-binding GntR family transcriptional regulator